MGGHSFAEAQTREANAARVTRYLAGRPPAPLASIADDIPRLGGGKKAGTLMDYMVRRGRVTRSVQPNGRALYSLPGSNT